MRRILILAAITFAGLAARLATADWGGLSGDEANGVAIALAPGWGDLWARLKEDGNPPLFYLLLRLAVFLLGDADFALRILAILVSAAIVPATFFIVGPVFGAPTAWQAALLVAFCPPLVRWGTMVRMYGILPLLSTASIFAGMRILAGERAPAWRVFHLAGTAALFYCHHWGFIVAAGQVLAGLAGWLGGRIAGRSVLALFLSLAGALAVYSLWLPTLLYVLAHNESPWATAPALSHLVIETPPEMLVGRLLLRDTWQELAIIACDLIAALAICLAPAAASRLCATKPEGKTPEEKAPEEKAAEEKAAEEKAPEEKAAEEKAAEEKAPEEKAAEEKAAEEKAAEEKAAEEKAPEEKAAEEKAAEEKTPEEKAAEEKAAEEKAAEEKATVSAAGQGGRPAWLLAATIIGGLAVAVALSSIKPGWRDRYLVCFTPGMLVLYAVFITGAVSALYRGLAPGRLPGFLRPVLPLLVLLPLWLPQLVWLKQMPESSAWAISEKIKAEARAEKDLIVVSWQASAPAISRTLPEKFRMVCFPDIERVKIIKWDGIDERLRDEGRLLLLLDRIAAVLADGGRIWLVDSSHSTGPAPPPGASAGLRGLHFNAAEQARMDQIRSWLLLNGEKQSLSLWAPGRDISLELSVWGMRSGRAGRDDTGRDDAGRDDTDKTGSDDGDERGPLPGAVGP